METVLSDHFLYQGFFDFGQWKFRIRINMDKLTIRGVALGLIMTSLPVTASNWHQYAVVGLGQSNMGQTQNVTLSPGVVNQYQTDNPSRYAAIVGLGAQKTVKEWNAKSALSAGFEALYLNDEADGLIRPLINVSPNFDQLNYSFSINSLLLLAKATATRQDLFKSWGGYIDAGLGVSFNGFSNYREITPAGSTAIPMASPFHRRSSEELAFSVGVGISHKVANRSQVSIGYRYLYAGTGDLGTSSVQNSTQHLSYKDLGYQLLTLTVSI